MTHDGSRGRDALHRINDGVREIDNARQEAVAECERLVSRLAEAERLLRDLARRIYRGVSQSSAECLVCGAMFAQAGPPDHVDGCPVRAAREFLEGGA